MLHTPVFTAQFSLPIIQASEWQAPPKGLHKDVIVCENLKLTFPSVNIYFLNFPELNIILAHQIQLFSWLYSGIRRQLSALLWLIQPYLWSNFTAK